MSIPSNSCPNCRLMSKMRAVVLSHYILGVVCYATVKNWENCCVEEETDANEELKLAVVLLCAKILLCGIWFYEDVEQRSL